MENINLWYIYICVCDMYIYIYIWYIYICMYIYYIWYIWSQQRRTAISCLKVICLTNVKKRSWPNLLWGRRLNHSSHSLATSTCSGHGAMELSNHQQWAMHRMTREHWICFILKCLKSGGNYPQIIHFNRMFINPPVPPFQETICAPAVGYLSWNPNNVQGTLAMASSRRFQGIAWVHQHGSPGNGSTNAHRNYPLVN